MHETLINLTWAATFALTGGLVGILLIFIAALLLPKLIDRFTPAMDEQQEIARGNRAVAEYFSRIVGASIIGMSLIIAAAILGGIIAALH